MSECDGLCLEVIFLCLELNGEQVFYANVNDCNAVEEESYVSSSDEESMEHFLDMLAMSYHIKKSENSL